MAAAPLPASQPPASPTKAPEVSFRDGKLSRAAIEAWLRLHPPSRRLEKSEALRLRIEERVVDEVLARRFLSLGSDRSAESQSWQRLLEHRLAAAALRRAAASEIVVPEAEVEAAYRASPHRFDHEQRWQLLNLYKRFPPNGTAEQRAEVRTAMTRLRERLAGGADFGALAREESESATRDRGGIANSAPLADLHPAVARVVATMRPGDLSPVVETENGLSLLRCVGIVPAVELSEAETRDRLRTELRGAAIERALADLDRRLITDMAPAYRLDPLGGSAEAVVAVLRFGTRTETILRRDLEYYLRDLRVSPPEALGPTELRKRTEELVLQVARAREAERRGLTASEQHRERFDLEVLSMRAELALAPEVQQRLVPPTDAEVADLFEKRREQLVEPGAVRIRTLEIPIRKELSSAYYRMVEAVGARLAIGASTLEGARAELAPHATLYDRGWMTEPEVWQMGRNVEAALGRLEPGKISAPVQEGRILLAIELLERRPPRPLTLDEARPRLAAALVGRSRDRIRAELRRVVAEEQEIRIRP